MKINILGESFIKNPRRNNAGRIPVKFYKELILIHVIENNFYAPHIFQEFVENLGILNNFDWDTDPTGAFKWKHYINRAKQELLDVGFLEKLDNNSFKLSERRKENIVEKYKNLFMSNFYDFEHTNKLIEKIESSEFVKELFTSRDLTDAREKMLSSIVLRRGQNIFRQQLLNVYENRCVISNCNVIEALEAAHIIPFNGSKTNFVQNGLLLRADLHALFDLKLISINENTYQVLVSNKLLGTYYEKFKSKKINLPLNRSFSPSKEALKIHHDESNI